ncbi:MAG TPA: DUF6519 domain-containing protein, partial [Streptomyces sp.]|nr:DUF6519 domain-containing protein [Streptomyces sp.]
MQGDFSRWTFDAQARYRAVLLQQGRVLLDSDWNEQGQIAAYHDEIRALDFLGESGCPAAGGGFEIVDAAGGRPAGAAWEQLAITPGRYYVDGILIEARGAGNHATEPIPLNALPDRLGPPEPAPPGRSMLYVDVWTHHVTMDEEPALREAALGGPDTTTRARTVWRIRTAPLAADTQCSDLRARPWAGPAPGTLTVTLGRAEPNPDPCRISISGGYTRLENQLYRVQIHDLPAQGEPRYLWSRENGSVTARIVDRTEPGSSGAETELVLDRVGRDEELSIRKDDTVEVTSAELQLRGEPGFLATAGAPRGLTLPVRWVDGRPPADLGRAPIVRRWDALPRALHPDPVELENNIHVAFSAAGEFHVGDYWLIPARSVRLAYGIADEQGTIDWPENAVLPPHGPVHHCAALAIVGPVDGGGWERQADCRPVAPPLTRLATLELVGGDGQSALAGEELPEPIRVVVRNGGVAVEGATVRFTASGGTVTDGKAKKGTGIRVRTDSHGMAATRWTPASDRITAAGDRDLPQTLVVQRLDDLDCPFGSPVIVTGQVCRPQLRLAGGDGQHLPPGARLLPEQIQVAVDSPLGPVAGVRVTATGATGSVVQRGLPGERRPAALGRTNRTDVVDTTAEGRAAFWWLPAFPDADSEVLTLTADLGLNKAPLAVTAQRLPQTGRTPGVHIRGLRIAGRAFANDMDVRASELAEEIEIHLDADVLAASVSNKPVVRVVLDLPWPFPGEAPVWSAFPIGFRAVELDADWVAEAGTARKSPMIVWRARNHTRT